ncbi:ParA family protein [Bacteroides pyogenes]|jgi:chromosome partitioning protein|uniref:ParA family protein n=1 Tax=Bacteroides pyogenes TaxID=310300 RepID=A0A5D3ECL7_9BACE|nr:ParA family protein [Bacteroides pyogenes]TYK32815.1 ParA family protein [Bacteroides pyogenes]
MGKVLPGIFVAFENPKGGTGKSTLTAIFAGYIHANKGESGLTVGVVDIDDAQNTLGALRAFENQEEEYAEILNNDEYQVMNISSSDFINSIDFLKENFDIILVDFPGNLKQDGVIETLMMIDIIIIPFAPSKIELMHTISFYNYYKENILAKREKLGYKTVIKGLPNKVTPNLLEYKELLANQDNLPFDLLKNHVKESKVNFQRNLSTIIRNYNNTCNEFGEEVVQLLIDYIKQ